MVIEMANVVAFQPFSLSKLQYSKRHCHEYAVNTPDKGCQTQVQSGPKLSSEVKSWPGSTSIEKLTTTDI